jgi:AraC-like DNA-binding protein
VSRRRRRTDGWETASAARQVEMGSFSDREIERVDEARSRESSDTGLASVVVLVRDHLAVVRLRAAFRPAPVHAIHSVAELHAAMATHSGRIACVLAEARDDRGRPVGPALTRLIERHPFIPFLGYCGIGAHHVVHVRELVRAGVHELVFANVDDHPALLRAKLVGGEEACAATAVKMRLAGLVPSTLRCLIEYCVHYPRDSHDVASIAAALGIDRRTLVKWCRRTHAPPPRAIVSWVRLLLAAELLRSPSQCVERVSNTLEFASSSAFRNLCRRHFGVRPTDLRTSAGRDLAYAAFTRAMHGQCEPAGGLADGACGERPAAHVGTP